MSELAGKIRGLLVFGEGHAVEILHSAAIAIEQLEALHAVALKHNPKPSTPEQQENVRERIARMTTDDHDRVVAVIMHNEEMTTEQRARIGQLWDKWTYEYEPQAKALLQMQLGECVAGLLEDTAALRERALASELDCERMRIALEQTIARAHAAIHVGAAGEPLDGSVCDE